MRILILSNLYPPNVIGGYERLCFDVAEGLAARGHAITVLTSTFGGRVAEYPGQTIHRVWTLLTGPDIYAPYQGSPTQREDINTANLAHLHHAIEQVRPDVVFAWNLFFLDASILDALERCPVPVVVMLTDNWLLVMRNGRYVSDFFRLHVHGAEPFRAPSPPPRWRRWAGRLKRILLRRPAARGPAAIFGSAFMRDLYRAGGVSFAHDRVIHNGVKLPDVTGRSARDRRELAEAGVLRLLFAGRLVDLKGADTAVAALALLEPDRLGVRTVRLTIVGDAQDRAYMARLEALIAAHPCRARIELRPAVVETALYDLFQAHDIYLFPSLYEPFSLTLIHALACGIPTIASDIGGNPEIVTDGESGLLFAKGDAADLTRKVMQLACDPALRARLSHGGQAAAARFGFDRMLDDMASFLRARTC